MPLHPHESASFPCVDLLMEKCPPVCQDLVGDVWLQIQTILTIPAVTQQANLGKAHALLHVDQAILCAMNNQHLGHLTLHHHNCPDLSAWPKKYPQGRQPKPFPTLSTPKSSGPSRVLLQLASFPLLPNYPAEDPGETGDQQPLCFI